MGGLLWCHVTVGADGTVGLSVLPNESQPSWAGAAAPYSTFSFGPSSHGQPKFVLGVPTTSSSSQVFQPTSPMTSVPGLPSAGFVLPVPGRTQNRNGLRRPYAQTRDRTEEPSPSK